MKISSSKFGLTKDGEEVIQFCLESEGGAKAYILNYGGILQSLLVPDRTGEYRDICLGYATVADYEKNNCYLGALIGRCANQIAAAQFDLNGKHYQLVANNGKNHLHGGEKGFDRRIWRHQIAENALKLCLVSADGEENYPGNLAVEVTYMFAAENVLSLVYEADTNQDTVVNLTNHLYFNLNGENSGEVLWHALQICSEAITPIDDALIPTGRLLPVGYTPFDFRTAKSIGQDLSANDAQLQFGAGYDHNFVLGDDDGTMKQAAAVYAAESGIALDVYTTMPGMQFYTANYLNSEHGKSGAPYQPRMDFCLETQHFPNAINCSKFPSPILKKGVHYHQCTQYRFSVK